MQAEGIIYVENVAALKEMSVDLNRKTVVMTLGAVTEGDGLGALYSFKPSSTTAEDTINWNTVKITARTTGRFEKIFVRKIVLPHGILQINSGIKKFYCNTVINASSEATINLTMDNTTNGVAIFNNVLWDDSKANTPITNVNDMVSSCRKSLVNSNKQLTHIFARGNSAVISVIGVNVLGLRSAAQNTPVTFIVEGE